MAYYIRPKPPSEYFPTAKKRSYLGEVGKGWLIQYTDFYLKIYPCKTQKGMLEIYEYRFGEQHPFHVEVIREDTLQEWSKQFDHCQ